MAEEKLELTVKINAQTGKLEVVRQKLNETGNEARNTSDKFNRFNDVTKRLLTTLGGYTVIRSLFNFVRGSVSDLEDYNEALRRVEFNVKAVGQAFDREAISNWAQELQNLTRFSDTEALDTFQRLIRATNDVNQAQRLAQVAFGISASSGLQLNQVVMILSNNVMRQTQASETLRREFGAFIGDAETGAEAVKRLSDQFKDAAIQEESLTKDTQNLSDTFSDLRKMLVDAFVPSLIESIKAVTDLTQGVINKMNDIEAKGLSVLEIHLRELEKERTSLRESVEVVTSLGMATHELTEEERQRLIFLTDRINKIREMIEEEKRAVESSKEGNTERVDSEQQTSNEVTQIRLSLLENLLKTGKADVKNYKLEQKKKVKISEESNEELIAIGKNTAESINREFSKSLTDTLFEGNKFKLKMSGIFRQLIQELIQLQLRMAATRIITGGFFGGASPIPTAGVGSARVPFGSSSVPSGVSGAPSVNVNVNLSTNSLDLSDSKAVMRALAEEIAQESSEAVSFAIRSQELSERNGVLTQ